MRLDVTVVRGHARFVDSRTVVVEENGGTKTVTADRIVIAVDTCPAKSAHVPFNDRTVFTTDTLKHLKQLPQSFLVVGGGVIGAELVSTLPALGVQVTLVEGRAELLGFVDREIIDAFQTAVRREGVTLRLGEKHTHPDAHPRRMTGLSQPGKLSDRTNRQAVV